MVLADCRWMSGAFTALSCWASVISFSISAIGGTEGFGLTNWFISYALSITLLRICEALFPAEAAA
jgi:hypothetical protein